ncbi:energy-coupled thiamine transporter ThiT [Desulfuribacillus stibiiarsenatis]|uniref:Energy-coupled thiamine transporter ThiT n=1 Tax=Desulfuribacillus stibiiarsenatis TaxID=1390249 RepID=A0A1E5L8W2_9FIRM|nr:energy-coupled thiamine transporter ThiT [Desulfuribacillus stibiiarsenatis]OEH86429.1 energy-coupled thiamine transporter ThiT [Desulfuribacillus stibiiarsenatis]
MGRERLITMMEIAILAGISVILGYLKFGALWAFGGSISLVMVPIFVIAYRRGWKAGIMTGFLVGVLHLITGATVVHPVQLVLDYPFAYTVLGFASAFSLQKADKAGVSPFWMIAGILLAATLRFISHFISGIIWFGEYAPEGMPVALYSFLYNISYLLPEVLITMVVVVLVARYYPRFFQVRK